MPNQNEVWELFGALSLGVFALLVGLFAILYLYESPWRHAHVARKVLVFWLGACTFSFLVAGLTEWLAPVARWVLSGQVAKESPMAEKVVGFVVTLAASIAAGGTATWLRARVDRHSDRGYLTPDMDPADSKFRRFLELVGNTNLGGSAKKGGAAPA